MQSNKETIPEKPFQHIRLKKIKEQTKKSLYIITVVETQAYQAQGAPADPRSFPPRRRR